jgi:hypothetical protein
MIKDGLGIEPVSFGHPGKQIRTLEATEEAPINERGRQLRRSYFFKRSLANSIRYCGHQLRCKLTICSSVWAVGIGMAVKLRLISHWVQSAGDLFTNCKP